MDFITSNMGVLSTWLLSAIGGIVWLVRLEGKVSANTKAIESNETHLKSIAENHKIIEQVASDINVIKNDMEWVKNKIHEKV